MFRAVLDTNVVISAKESKHPQSPNVEIVRRWAKGDFVWLFSEDTLEEYAEKLLERGLPRADVLHFVRQLLKLGEEVAIAFFHVRHYPADPDDTAFLLAALNGNASHLVTYDTHLQDVGIFYPEFHTCKPMEFLTALRP
jgi:putative PIN family toxin of toxin-antitoxin system